MKLAKRSLAFLLLLTLMAGRSAAQGVHASAQNSVTVNTACNAANGTRFNLEPRANPLPQNTESVDFLLNRAAPGVDLVVGAANDRRSSLGGFDAYYVHRTGTNCAANFEGTLNNATFNPMVAADPARDAFFLGDVFLGLNQVVEVARTTATNLLSTSACPSGTRQNGSNPNCWPLIGTANFTNPSINQAALFQAHMAVDPRTSGTGAGDVYVVAQFINSTNFPAVANIQVVACTNATVSCGSPIIVSGADPFASRPYVQVRPDGVITISYWTFTNPNNGAQPNPINIKFLTCTPQGAPNPPACSAATVAATSNVPGLFSPGDSGFHDFLFPKHADRLEADGKTVTTFLVYDNCQAIIPTIDAANPPCSKVDAVFQTSTDGGATWSAQQALESSGHQFFSTVRNDTSTGTINIAYYSTQDDLFFQRAKVRLRQIAAGSTVPGPSNILTTNATDPDAGLQDLIEPGGEGFIDFGDRIGLAVAGTGAAGQSKAYVHFTSTNTFGSFDGTNQPDQNNTLLGLSY